jgi:hypothetical protein
MGKKNKGFVVFEESSSDERTEKLYDKNKTRGRRPFKTRDSVGERPVGIREQRSKKRDSE